MPQDGQPDSQPNRIARDPAAMGGGWTESAVETLRGALLLTPPGRALEASQALMALRDMADQRLVQESAGMLGLALDSPMNVHVSSVHAWMRMHGTTILSPLNIPASGPGRDPALAAIADLERRNPGLFNKMMTGDQQARDRFQQAVNDAVANPSGRTQPAVPTPGDVRITGGCSPIRICFWPGADIRNNATKMREFRRQLALQERGLNALPPSSVVSNRAAYCASAKLPDPSQAIARAAYQRAYSQHLRMLERTLPARARAIAELTRPVRVRAHMRNVAALHNPDRIAGGDPTVVFSPADAASVMAGGQAASIGDKGINSSIGSLWGGCGSPGSRSSRLAAHAARQAANGCKSVQASLEVCQN
ncbi:MAG: polymorphic toxin type 15 domain-containing protein [Tabrizicola sp.]|jgi:hypothetical protein|nr:polymorphic toxin type 15 domain-containing protein [Tabrizicola sp.]